jgi:predicted phosphodiesterase
MRLLHLSDIHYSINKIDSFNNYIKQPLFAALINEKCKIDAIIISGDLIDRGGLKNYDDNFLGFYEFVTELSKVIAIDMDKIIIVPGNHDVSRHLDEEHTESGLGNFINNKPEFVDELIDKNYTDVITEGLKRIIPYVKCSNEYYKDNQNVTHNSNFDMNIELKVDGFKVAISVLNTAWRCYGDDDATRVQLGIRQLESAIKNSKNCDYRILTMHHHHESFKTNNDYYEIQSKITEHFNLACYGHIHDNDCELSLRGDGAVFVSVAPALNIDFYKVDKLNKINGYRILDVNLNIDPHELNVEYYCYRKQHNDFVLNTMITKDNSGIETYTYPTKPVLIKRSKLKEVIFNSKERFEEEANSSLLSALGITNAPKKIDSIFVIPSLSCIDKDNEKEKVSIESVLSSDKDYYIFGRRESGKSLLLSKFYIDLAEKFSVYNCIPIYVDILTVKVKNISLLVRTSLGISITEYKELVNEGKVVFIVDNASFEADSEFIKLRSAAQNEFENCRFITCADTTLSGEIPLDFYKEDVCTYQALKINAFNSKQVRELTTKWYSNENGKNNFDSEKVIDKIVGIIKKMGIENNPLTISMFLMIFEQNKNYNKLNNATIIEKFVEKSLEKNAEKHSYRFTFDFHNAEILLSEIAQSSTQLLPNKFGLQESQLVIFIDLYLKQTSKCEAFQTADILRKLTDSGILVREQLEYSIISFRYSCVYYYYLMKYMVNNEAYRNVVLSKENILNYISVVDLYTSSHRMKDDVLKVVLELYDSKFEDIINKLNENFKSFDGVFKVDEEEYRLVLSDPKEIVERIKRDKDKEKSKDKNEKIDIMRNEVLCSEASESEIDKFSSTDLSKLDELERIMVLTAYVVRNLEESRDQELLIRGTRSSIRASLTFASIYRVILIEALKRKENIDEFEARLIKTYLNLFPLFNQIMIGNYLHSPQMLDISKIILNEFSDELSQIEQFTHFFTMIDCKQSLLREPEYLNRLMSYSKTYLSQNIFLKLLDYYFENDNSGMDDFFLNVIADCLPTVGDDKIKHNVKSKAENKGKYIEALRHKKMIYDYKKTNSESM